MIRLRTLPLAIVTVALIFGGIAVAASLNLWKTESTKEPVKFKTGELAGLPNPADIRGSYTWLDIETAFGVNAAEAAAAFSTAELQLAVDQRVNALEGAYAGKVPAGREIGTDSVRLFVALMAGLPHEPEEGTALPDAAIAFLLQRGKIDATAAALWGLGSAVPCATEPVAAPAAAPAAQDAAPAVKPAETSKAAAAPAPVEAAKAAPADAEHVPADRVIAGKTTFGDLYLWGLSEAEVEAAAGFAPGPRSQSVRDGASAAGASFSAIKPKLQELVDAKKK